MGNSINKLLIDFVVRSYIMFMYGQMILHVYLDTWYSDDCMCF